MSTTPPVPLPSIEPADVLDLLTSLVEKSLAIYEADDQGCGRYRLLETVRQYARDRLLESQESEALRDRHRDWFVCQAERLLQQSWTEQEPYFAFAGAEHENLRQAFEWSLRAVDSGQSGTRGAGDVDRPVEQEPKSDSPLSQPTTIHYPPSTDPEKALQLAGDLWLYWFHAGALAEARSRLEAALASAPAASAVVRAKALAGLGMVAFTDSALARRSLEESVTLFRAAGEALYLSTVLNPLGYLYASVGEPERGKALLDEALALCCDHGDQYVVYNDLHRGLYAQVVKEHAEAERLLERVVAHPRTWGSVRHFALATLGEARLELGKYPLARKSFVEALAQARPMHGTLTILKCLCGLARAWMAVGETARAARLLGAAAAQAERLGMSHLPADLAAEEATVTAARAALGEERFQAAFAQGQAMTLDQAIDLALPQGPDEAEAPDRSGPEDSP